MRSPRSKDRGFTLVEVLAALLVFSLAIIGLTHAGTQSAQAVSVISEKSAAGIVADNVMIQSRLKPLKLGSEDGQEEQMGRSFNYVVTTAKTSTTNLYKVSVKVSRDKSEQVILSRDSFRGGE